MQYRSVFSLILLTIGIAWLGLILWDNIHQLKEISENYSYIRLLIALPFSVLALYTSAVTFYLILIELVPHRPPFLYTFLSYLESQIVRYLPGKIWGVIHQTNKMQDHTPRHAIWETNIVQFIIGDILSIILFGWAIIYKKTGIELSLIYLSILMLVFYASIQKKAINHIIRYFIKKFTLSKSVDKIIHYANKTKEMLVSLTFEWLFYLTSWAAMIYPIANIKDTIILSIIYVAAWLIGFVGMVSPGGVVIRESAFISLGLLFGYPAGNLAFYAILARLLFLLSDIIGIIVAYVVIKKNRTLS